MGQSLQIVGRRKSLHVRNALKATVGRQSIVRRDGPKPDLVLQAGRLTVQLFARLVRHEPRRRRSGELTIV
jgi:hypothetical protein